MSHNFGHRCPSGIRDPERSRLLQFACDWTLNLRIHGTKLQTMAALKQKSLYLLNYSRIPETFLIQVHKNLFKGLLAACMAQIPVFSGSSFRFPGFSQVWRGVTH